MRRFDIRNTYDDYEIVYNDDGDACWHDEASAIIEQLRDQLNNIKQEVALDCALMAESDYSTADVAIEIREKYGLPDATYGEIL